MTVIGRDRDTGVIVTLDAEARSRSTYEVGVTGTGKTTTLQSISYQDMKAGHGLCLLDAHGDMIPWLLARVPPEREMDVILFDPIDQEERPFGLNLLAREQDNAREVRWVVSSFAETLRRMFAYSWGPLLEHVLNHALWTAMAIPGSTIIDVLLLLTDKVFRRKWIKRLEDPLLINFWREFPKVHKQQMEYVSSTLNKLTPFLLDETMKFIVGQSENTFDMREVMDEQKILLVNLSKGQLGENNSRLLGSVLVNLVLVTALSRQDMDPAERRRRPFHLIVDEFQNFASDSFSILQTECRKMGVDVIAAHQHRDQLPTDNLKGSALNVGNFLCFRTTGQDGLELASQFDNTPPPPDKVWEYVRIESMMYMDEFQRCDRERQVDGPRRLYSDVMMERANNLANQDPFHFQARFIARDPENGRLRLAAHALETVNPQLPEDATKAERDFVASLYGTPDEALAERIRRRCRGMGVPREEVAAAINLRTFDRARVANPPALKPVAASEEADESDVSWLMEQETAWYWDGVE